MHTVRKVTPQTVTPPIEALEHYFRAGGATIVKAAFAHSYFIAPEAVRARTPYYPERARTSHRYYPGKGEGKTAKWEDGREVKLDLNNYAQEAWTAYTGCPILRRSGYGMRHIWGHPWNPDAFTAGWNLCYMPFWAGMLTEEQHPLPLLKDAIQQASWDLYFRDAPVCEPPDFVRDVGLHLGAILEEQPLLIMEAERKSQPRSYRPRRPPKPQKPRVAVSASYRPSQLEAKRDAIEHVKWIRNRQSMSWTELHKGILEHQNLPHEPFNTPVGQTFASGAVRKMLRETDLTPAELQAFFELQPTVQQRMKQR